MNQIKLYESPIKDQNEEKYGYLASKQCICCMKPLKHVETKYVHMSTDWMVIRNDIDDNQLKELGLVSQGCFQIGNSCAKKMDKNYIHQS